VVPYAQQSGTHLATLLFFYFEIKKYLTQKKIIKYKTHKHLMHLA